MNGHVLVTGGAGYLGSILVEHLLREGFSVAVIDNLMYGQRPLFHLCHYDTFTFHYGDVRDESLLRQELRRADVIIPLAAVVGAPACDRNPWLARAINVEAIRRLDSLRSPRQLVVYPNTNSGYGTQSGEVYCTEETPMEPISLYGQLKVEAEQYLLDRPNTIALRLATVFGVSPRMRIDLLVNFFVYEAVKRGYLVIFEKDFKRNYVHVRDVADCFLHCIYHAETMVGRPYNLGLESANLSKEELAYKVQKHVPNLTIHFAEIGTDPDRRNYIVSSQRLREAGFVAKRTLDEGIQELIRAYRMMTEREFRNY